MNAPPRVALVTNVLAHYRVECFRRLAGTLGERLRIFLLSAGMEHRRYVQAAGEEDGDGAAGALPLTRLRGWRLSRPPADDRHLNDPRPLLRFRPEVVILGGWDEPTYLLLWAWAVARRRRLIFWIESTAGDFARSRLREGFKRFLLGRAAACLVPGRRAGDYCRQLGVPAERVFVAPNAAGRAYFRSAADRLLPKRDELRRERGLAAFTVLFAGRLVEAMKGVATLIDACARLARAGTPVTLLVAGEGPDEVAYREQAARNGLAEVRFLGTLDHDALCPVYAAADVLALPSRTEVWGFVLNEGMEFGLPLVVSEAVGAEPDLVREGENGFVVPVGDVEALAAALSRLAGEPELRRRMGEASRRIVEGFSPQAWADGALAAVAAACSRPG